MKISTTKIRQIIKEELQRVLGEGHDDLPSGAGSTIYGPRAGGNLAGQRSDGRNAKKLTTTAQQSAAKKEENKLEDLALMAAAAQENSSSNEAYLKLASEKSGRKVTNKDPLTPRELRKMIEPMDLADRLRLTNTINLSFGRAVAVGPESADAAYEQAKAMFTDPDGPGSDAEVAAAQPPKSTAAAHAAYDRYMKANK